MKKISLSDVARQAGVSKATVSRALNESHLVNPDTYAKILKAMDALGYKPGEVVSRFSTAAMSKLLLVDIPSIQNPFYNDIVLGIESVANRNDYYIIINSAGYKSLLSLCQETKIGGIITMSGFSATQLDRLSSLTTVVQCTEFCKGYPLPYVSIDDYAATKEALEYLYSLGRREFSIINHSSDFKFAQERERAFRDFLTEKGLAINEDLMISLPSIDYNLAVSAVKCMFSKGHRPDAIFAVSDMFAAGAIKVAAALHINVPDDVSIIGFDNLPLSNMVAPSISSIKQPRFEMGAMACEFIIEKIKQPDIPDKQYLLETELVIRESTQKKPNAS